MQWSDWGWIAIIAVGLAYEIYTIVRVRGGSLTDTIRRWFQTHKTPGRLIFLIAWLGFAGWFAFHILG